MLKHIHTQDNHYPGACQWSRLFDLPNVFDVRQRNGKLHCVPGIGLPTDIACSLFINDTDASPVRTRNTV
jgi:hypothetical protein